MARKGLLPPSKRKSRGRPDRPPPRKKPKPLAPPPLPAPEEPSDGEVSDADLDFVREHGGSIGFLTELRAEELDKQLQKGAEAKQKGAKKKRGPREEEEAEGEEGAEALYESRPRKGFAAEKEEEDEERPPQAVLPVKDARGRVSFKAEDAGGAPARVPQVEGVRVLAELQPLPSAIKAEPSPEEGEGAASKGEPMDSDADGEEAAAGEGTDGEAAEQLPEGAEEPAAAREDADESLEAWQGRQERREEAKQHMAAAALKLLQTAEPSLKDLRAILAFAAGSDPVVKRLALVSLLAVFRGLLPGYCIRPQGPQEGAAPLSKEVRRLQEHEAGLLKAYQGYLKLLLAAVRMQPSGGGAQQGAAGRGPAQRGPSAAATARAAARCLAGLLASAPHFNYAADILQALMGVLNHRDAEVAGAALGALGALLGDALAPAVLRKQAVQLVAEMVRVRKCGVREEVGWALLVLEFSDRPGEPLTPAPKDRRLAKTKRKAARLAKARQTPEEKAVTAAFKEAEASADVAESRAAQSAALEALFEVFFRALKHCSGSGLVRGLDNGGGRGPQGAAAVPLGGPRVRAKFPLLAPALVGLGKYARHIGVEYQADMLAELTRLAASPQLPLRPRLQALLAASDIHRSQCGALALDREDLYQALFATLSALPLSPFLDEGAPPGPRSPQGAAQPPKGPPQAAPAGAGAGESVEGLALAVLLRMLCEEGRGLAGDRPAAFALRLASVAHFVAPKLAAGLLGILDKMLRASHKLRGLLDQEPGPGRALPAGRLDSSHSAESLAAACGAASTAQLWELALLRVTQPHSHVLAAARGLASLPVDRAGGKASAVLELYNASPKALGALAPKAGPKGCKDPAEGLRRFQQLLHGYYLAALRVGDSDQERHRCAQLAVSVGEARKALLDLRRGQPSVKS